MRYIIQKRDNALGNQKCGLRDGEARQCTTERWGATAQSGSEAWKVTTARHGMERQDGVVRQGMTSRQVETAQQDGERQVNPMRLTKGEKELCEISGCGGRAEHTINLNRRGVRSNIHICGQCLKNLYSAVGEALVPKSIETIRKTGGAF